MIIDCLDTLSLGEISFSREWHRVITEQLWVPLKVLGLFHALFWNYESQCNWAFLTIIERKQIAMPHTYIIYCAANYFQIDGHKHMQKDEQKCTNYGRQCFWNCLRLWFDVILTPYINRNTPPPPQSLVSSGSFCQDASLQQAPVRSVRVKSQMNAAKCCKILQSTLELWFGERVYFPQRQRRQTTPEQQRGSFKVTAWLCCCGQIRVMTSVQTRICGRAWKCPPTHQLPSNLTELDSSFDKFVDIWLQF